MLQALQRIVSSEALPADTVLVNPKLHFICNCLLCPIQIYCKTLQSLNTGEKKVFCALKWTKNETFFLLLIVPFLDFVWGYSKRCSKASTWLCLLSSGKDGCVECEWFYSCAHTGLDYLEIHEDFCSDTFVRELQLCSSFFCSVTTTLKPMSRMRGMLFRVVHHVVSAHK